MNEFTAWMQSNWYELGNLFTDFVFLAVGIWFARKILRTLRASQEQVGTLIKLTVAGTVPSGNPQVPPRSVRSRPEPVLAYAVGDAFCQPASAVVREPLVGCRARHSGVVEHSNEERQRGTAGVKPSGGCQSPAGS